MRRVRVPRVASPAWTRRERPGRHRRARPAHPRFLHPGVTLASLLVPALRWDSEHGFTHLRRMIDEALGAGVGGFLFFGGPRAAAAELAAELHARSAIPLLLAADAGRAAGQQFDGSVTLPPLGALGFLNDPSGMRRAGQVTARDLKRTGLNWALAPVCDLDFAPGNTIIGTRAAGRDPEGVGTLIADYLVMAAWLAFLKSRLLLPEPVTADGPSAEEMATALANRLRRLEAIREASNRLMNRPQLQRDIFPRGNPESIAEIRHPRFTATLFDLLTAYAAQRQQRVLASVHLAKRTVWSLTEARASLERLVGMAEDWSCLDEYLLNYVVDPTQKATVFASSFAAALELVREGEVELHQKEAFAPLYFRKRPPQPASDAMTAPDLPAE